MVIMLLQLVKTNNSPIAIYEYNMLNSPEGSSLVSNPSGNFLISTRDKIWLAL